MATKQHKESLLEHPVTLCDAKGQLNPLAIGYAKTPLIESNLSGHYMRKKKWNYWCVFGEEILFSATISHMDYAAVCFVYLFHYESQQMIEKTVTIPLGRGVSLSPHVLGPATATSNEMQLRFIPKDGNKTLLEVIIDDFDGEPLRAELLIKHPVDQESLNVVIPWDRNHFQFTAKHHTLPAEGTVSHGDHVYTFEDDESFAVLDYGRGIWPRSATWNWGFASQRIGNRKIGLNFGGKWTDGTGMTENAVLIDGKLYKISEDVLFTYDSNDFMKPWTLKTKFSSDVSLTFIPFYERVARTDVKLVYSEVHQMFGYFKGTIHLEGYGKVVISHMLGCVEEHIAKW
ncbi:hypothetical protein CQS04_06380 [Chryseomicrobium excrementi]|uniref:DUF2804 domain-containing protein n=1 Tax=Chryseomicrobium excrementi TaxID=2041346 RepID=A0A2M9EZY7_9BACL|nr:DUF2804 domain-containing protein [Chryseomicrobium excrementi]PJK16777.1 hypothetical protein CQS04_06380 [Chryseomicrobium excrementi]